MLTLHFDRTAFTCYCKSNRVPERKILPWDQLKVRFVCYLLTMCFLSFASLLVSTPPSLPFSTYNHVLSITTFSYLKPLLPSDGE